MKKNLRTILKKGTLWQKLLTRTDNALRSGTLLPMPTDYEYIEDRGVRFLIRILLSLSRKDEERHKQHYSSTLGKQKNPFLPYDKNLFVSDISETHIALLNKFNVVEHHLLVVTRYFEDQETLLTVDDFAALWVCMEEYKGLGFYNGGEAAGASQQHKHLQMVPLPLAPEGPEIPIESLFSESRFEGEFGFIPRLPFLHAFVRLEDVLISSFHEAAERTFNLYSAMLKRMKLETPNKQRLKRQSAPYCLLITRHWMLLVPRSREFFDSISMNSLAFAGALLVRNKEQMNRLKKYGPMAALKHVALPVL